MPGLRSIRTIVVVSLLSGCARQPVTAFAGRTPPFDLATFYSGHSKGYGFVFSRSGDVVKQFTADENGTFDGRPYNEDEGEEPRDEEEGDEGEDGEYIKVDAAEAWARSEPASGARRRPRF